MGKKGKMQNNYECLRRSITEEIAMAVGSNDGGLYQQECRDHLLPNCDITNNTNYTFGIRKGIFRIPPAASTFNSILTRYRDIK